MARPMSAQQVMELQQKKKINTPSAMAANPAINAVKPMAAMPKPATTGVVPKLTGMQAVKPMPAMPQAAQMKTKGVIPNMPLATGPKNLIGTPGQAAKPTNLIGTPKPSVPTPMSASQAATPKPNNMTANGGYIPLSNNITDLRSGDQLNQLAADQLATERAGLQNAADTQTASLQNSAKYANQLIQDNRVLEDGNFARTNAPAAWDGSVGYRGAMLDRGRQIDDTMRAADLANAMNSVQQELYNFDTNAAAKERGIANELLQNERGYGLDVGNQAISKGQLTGEYFDPQAQNIANQIIGLKQQAEATGITAQDRAALSTKANGLRSQLSNMGYDANQFGANVNSSAAQGNMSGLGQKTLGQQSQDFNETQQGWENRFKYGSAIGQFSNGQQTLEGKQVESSLVTEQQARDLATRDSALREWSTAGTATPAVASILGVPVGAPTSSEAYQQASITLDQDKFTYAQWSDAANAQNNNTQTVTAATAGDMLSQALQKVVGMDELTGKQKYGVYSDPARREEAFVNMLNTTGLRGPDVVTALTKAGYSMQEINALQKEYSEYFQ